MSWNTCHIISGCNQTCNVITDLEKTTYTFYDRRRHKRQKHMTRRSKLDYDEFNTKKWSYYMQSSFPFCYLFIYLIKAQSLLTVRTTVDIRNIKKFVVVQLWTSSHMLLSLMSSSVITNICRLFQICDIITLIMCFKTVLYKERVCCFYVSYDVQINRK